MKHMTMQWQEWLMVAILVTMPAVALAVMPPYAEARAALARIERAARLRADAPERVQIEITASSFEEEAGSRCPSLLHWHINANVLSVERGDLQIGQAVSVRYDIAQYLCPGPIHEQMPALQNGTQTIAFLQCEAAACQPAAGEMSFLSQESFERERANREAAARQYEPRPVSPPDALLRQTTICFGERSLVLHEPEQSVLRAHAGFLGKAQTAHVQLVGHGDLRTTREYAFGIGERRAQVVRDALIASGVKADQIDTLSVGREMPLDKSAAKSGACEARVEIRYALPGGEK